MHKSNCFWIIRWGLVVLTLCWPRPVIAQAYPETVRIYLDSDRSVNTASTHAIEAGIRVALHEHGDQLGGRPVELVLLDHRGNVKRSQRSFEQFAKDPAGLAVFSGIHSPPLLAHRDSLINAQGLLTLDPWAAAGPITRPPTPENWIFRLSVDDTNAGVFIAHQAMARGVRRPALLLEKTGWGESNHQTMTKAIRARLGFDPSVTWFNWGTSEATMRIKLREIVASGADAVFFVGNVREGVTLTRVLSASGGELNLPVYSHWGITGGDFFQQVGAETLAGLEWVFIQTRFQVAGAAPGSKMDRLLKTAQTCGMFLDAQTTDDIDAPTGFVHAYDLTKIFIAAVKQAGLTDDVIADRKNIRTALQSLKVTVPGLIRDYDRPFGPYTQPGSAAHEALTNHDYTLARYDHDGVIRHIDNADD